MCAGVCCVALTCVVVCVCVFCACCVCVCVVGVLCDHYCAIFKFGYEVRAVILVGVCVRRVVVVCGVIRLFYNNLCVRVLVCGDGLYV